MGAVRRAWKTVSRNATYAAVLAARRAFVMLPAGARLAVGARLGAAAWQLARSERRRALDHLAAAFGAEKPPGELRRIARECFRNLGRSTAEVAGLWAAPPRQVLDLFDGAEGIRRMTELLAAGRGLVVVTAHLDNWELCGAYVAAAGLPVSVVARRIYFEKYDLMVNAMRRRFGMEIIYQDASPRALLRALRAGRLLALLADQDVPRLDGVFVPFFGRPAYTPTGPVSLALASGAPLVLAYSLHEGYGRHRFVVEGPVEFDRSDKRRALLEGTRGWCALLERAIRAHPEQWVWMHRRWRTRPEDRPEAARRSGLCVPGAAAEAC